MDPSPILVVTDDPHLTVELRYGLPAGLEAMFARDAREALSLMKGSPPSAVIVDLQTGSAGGFSLASEMRLTEGFADTPVVMLLERAQDRWLAEQAGAKLVRVKPIEASVLYRDLLKIVAA